MNKSTLIIFVSVFVFFSCKNNSKTNLDTITETQKVKKYPSDVLPFLDKWKILLGDGTYKDSLINYKKNNFFYVENEGKTDWVVYKTPNSGVTSKTSKNTRTELGQKEHWIPEVGGKLTGTLKVKHVLFLVMLE